MNCSLVMPSCASETILKFLSCSCPPPGNGEEEVGDELVNAFNGDEHEAVLALRSVVDVPVLQPGKHLTMLMFGMTGTGKSSLGNLIAGKDIFKSGDSTTSVTKMNSVMRYEEPDGSLIVLDTVGLGDTSLSEEQVALGIRDVCLSAPGGIDMLVYVMRLGRITDDCISRLIYVTQYLWGNESLQNLYVVVTCATRYMNNPEDATQWIEAQAEADWRFQHIYTLVGKNPSRFIFVENPPLESGTSLWTREVKEKRQLARKAVFEAFCAHPRDTVPPFTASMMRQVQNAVKVEQQDLHQKQREVARIKDELRARPSQKAKAKQQRVIGEDTSKSGSDLDTPQVSEGESPASPKTPSSIGTTGPKPAGDSSAKPKRQVRKSVTQDLQNSLTKATQDVAQAQSAIEAKISEVKQDKQFNKQVEEHAKKGTMRFGLDFRRAGAGTSGSPGGKSGFLGFGKKLFGGFGGKKDSPPGIQEFAAVSAKQASESVQNGLPCLIFDWDDTLCPTWWLRCVMQPSLSRVDISAYNPQLTEHAGRIETLLRSAKSVGNVDIVTLANKQWLDQTIRWLGMGGVDLYAVLQELNIAVHYATPIPDSEVPAGQEAPVLAKKVCMQRIMDKYYGTAAKSKVAMHAMSLGDQPAEAVALKEVMKEAQRKVWSRPICKVLRFPEEPMIEDIGVTLQQVTAHLPSLVQRTGDFDLSTRTLGKA
eukprot:TRINITY_DN91433_c0_g1_i1.p1 TRINITY_DN91433_c0_g1~~TRINITY_DN91433_c0_g1_i1.p1  ORF type:complete len:705 (+),score=167.55 TRINITY_DN91433_c0_g1_i1:80-2194(+)